MEELAAQACVNEAWDHVKDKLKVSPCKRTQPKKQVSPRRPGALLEIQEENEEFHISPQKAKMMDNESSFSASESPSPKKDSPIKENVPSVCPGIGVSDL
jgi:hypothetical protein